MAAVFGGFVASQILGCFRFPFFGTQEDDVALDHGIG
jgi:hypothetical protein